MTAPLFARSGLTAASPKPEEWRPVVGYEGFYEVSSLGNVRSNRRTGGNNATYGGRSISVITNSYGYLVVNLSKDNQARQHRVHRLVASAFLGPCPAGMVVAHGDGSRTNNALSNLRYASNKENEADKDKHGTRPRGEKHGCAVLTESKVREIRASGLTPKLAAERYSISASNAGRILRRQNWRHVA